MVVLRRSCAAFIALAMLAGCSSSGSSSSSPSASSASSSSSSSAATVTSSTGTGTGTSSTGTGTGAGTTTTTGTGTGTTTTGTGTTTPAFSVAGWLPNWSHTRGGLSVKDQIGHALDECDVFSYGAKKDGSLAISTGAHDATLLREIHAANGKAFMTIFGSGGSSILASASAKARFVQTVVDECVNVGYDGADLDWESLAHGERAGFTDLCQKLHDALHAKQKLLSITVIPKLKDHPAWGAADALDFAALAPLADSFKMMTYGDHGPWSRTPGPIGALGSTERFVKWAIAQGVAKEKILLGIPFFGFDWPQAGAIRAVTWSQAQSLIAKSSGVVFDAAQGESHFEYVDAAGTRHVCWFQDAQSVAAKAALAKRLGIGGVCCWAIGGEPRAFWDELEKAKR